MLQSETGLNKAMVYSLSKIEFWRMTIQLITKENNKKQKILKKQSKIKKHLKKMILEMDLLYNIECLIGWNYINSRKPFLHQFTKKIKYS